MARPKFVSWILRWGFLAFIYYTTSAFVLNTFMQEWEFLTDHNHNGFTSMVTFTATRPWAYRVLMPLMIDAGAALVPQSFVRSHEAFFTSGSNVLKYMKVKDPPGWNAEFGVKYHVAYFLIFLTIFATMWLTRYLARLHLNRGGLLVDLAPVVALILLPMTFLMGGFIYDFAELFFCVAALICMQKRWLGLYYVVFVLAILNKESNVLLFLYFAVLMLDTMPRRWLAVHLAAQAALGGAILFTVRRLFAGNAGEPTMFHLFTNIRFYSHPIWLVRMTDIYANGIPVPRAFNVVNLVMLAAVVSYRWTDKPVGLRRLLVVMLVVMVPLWFVSGYYDEVRNLSLVFPVLFLLALYTFASLYADAEQRAAAVG